MIHTKEQIDRSLLDVEKIRQSGGFADDLYHKLIVCVAYEYLVAGEQQQGLVQLSRVPPSYFLDVQVKQMDEDRSYRDLVVLLSYKLVQLGVVDMEEHMEPTMAPAEA